MSRRLKIIFWLAGLLILLLLGVVIAAKLLITPEGVRLTLLPLAEEKLGRSVEIGNIQVELLSGITLEKISIPSDQKGLPLFQADKATLRYRFWPLLTGKIMIDQVSLQNPVLRLQRNTEGVWNLAELLDPEVQPDNRKTSGGARDQKGVAPATDEGAGFSLLITNLLLAGGQIEISDQKLNPEAPFYFKLQEVGLVVKDFSLGQPFPIDATVQINAAPLRLTGSFDPAGRQHELNLQTTDFDLAPISPYFRDLLPGIFSRAKLSTDLTFSGNQERFDLRGKLSLDEIHLVLEALQNSPIRGASLVVEPDMTVDRSVGLMTVRPSTVAVDGVSVKLSGAIDKIENLPTLKVQVAWSDIGLREFLAVVPSGLLPRLDQVDPAGKLSGTLDLQGDLSQPAALIQAGKLSLTDVQANLGAVRPALTGVITLVGQGLAGETLRLRMGDDEVDISFTVKDFLAKPLQIQSQVLADKIDIDRILNSFSDEQPKAIQKERAENLSAIPGSESQQKIKAKVAKPKDLGPFDLPLAVDGTIVINSALIKGLTVSDFNVGYQLVNNSLDIRRMSGTIAGGRFQKSGKVNLGKKGLPYQTKIIFEDVQAEEIINAMLPEMQGSLSGKMNFEASLSGAGTTASSISKHLTGQGRLNLVEGLANGTKISRGLVNLLGMKQLEQIDIKTADVEFKINQGVVNISGVVAGRDLQMVPDGQIRLDGPVNIGLPTRLAPKVAAQLSNNSIFNRLLKDDDGWTVLPLKVKGRIDDPLVALDEKQLGRQAEKIKQQLEQDLLKKLAPEEKGGRARSIP